MAFKQKLRQVAALQGEASLDRLYVFSHSRGVNETTREADPLPAIPHRVLTVSSAIQSKRFSGEIGFERKASICSVSGTASLRSSALNNTIGSCDRCLLLLTKRHNS